MLFKNVENSTNFNFYFDGKLIPLTSDHTHLILAASNCSLSNLHELETPQLPQTSHAYSKRQILVECKEELGESSNYFIISKTVAHPLIYSILSPHQSKVRLFTPFEMATILLFHSVDFLLPEILSSQLQ
jgi:hypothetical protein